MKRLLVVAIVAATVSLAAEQRPVFKSGVDIVAVEVLALDRNGRPVTDLTAADFFVTAGGRPRRIVAAEYVATATAAPAKTAGPATLPIPMAASNAARPAGRTFLFLVDTSEIQFGDGSGAMQSIATFVDGLSRDDLAGVVSLPTGVPRVDLTTDREPLKKALRQIRGTSTRRNECDPTPGEAVAIVQGGQKDAYLDRVRGLSQCPLDILPSPERSAERVLDIYRLHARQVFDVAGGLATAMSTITGHKTLVLVSEGLLSDPSLAHDLVRFGGVLEQARVRLYALKLDAPFVDVTARTPTTRTGILDNRLGLNGMMEATIAGGGETFRGTSSVKNGLDQIDAQLGGWIGMWRSAGRGRALRVAGAALIASGVLGFFAQVIFPMHMRGAAPTISDTMHATLTIVYVVVVLVLVASAAAGFGWRFRIYSAVTILVLAVFGMLAGQDMSALAAQQPTPWLGLNERVNAYAYQLWIAVLAIALLRVDVPVRTQRHG